MVTATAMNYVEEAFGITRAAQSVSSPVAISFTVETDDNLPTGQTRKDAIVQVGQATENAPAYYMINCAHPTHFASILASGESWVERIRGRRVKVKFEIFSVINNST